MLQLRHFAFHLMSTLALMGCSSERGTPADELLAETSETVVGTPTYPLRIAAGGRYLEDQAGKPFLWVGDSVWAGAASLSPSEMDLYLDNRSAKGFTVVLASLLESKFSKNAPNDAAGHPPFTGWLAPGVFDISKPNEAYFATVEALFQKAAARGMVVLVAYNYLGYDGGDEGWFSTLKANGAPAVRQFGRYIGNRYRNQSNIVWLAGGDYTPSNADQWVIDEAALGIREGGSTQLMTVHSARGEVSADIWGTRSWYDLQTIYTGPPAAIPPLFRTAYARQPAKPSFLVEARYENHLDWTPAMLRYQAYQPYLSGGMGQMFGNDPIWHANGPGLGNTLPFTWQQALDQQGSQDVSRLASVLASREWWKLVPDVNHALLTSGFNSGLSEVVAARASDGSFALVYVPSTGTSSVTFTTALNQLAGAVAASWYNPTSGQYTTVPGSPFANTGSRTFTTPGNNGTATNDWLLTLIAGAAAPAPILTTIGVNPGTATVSNSQLFAATAYDQSGQPLSAQPAFAWTVSGGGSISSSGLFTASGPAGGPYTVTAAASGKTGTASVTIVTESQQALSPSADAYVRDGDSAASNFGTPPELLVKNEAVGWNRQSYVKFDIGNIPPSLVTAKLRLFGGAGEPVTVQAYGASSTWSEATLSWNNKPSAVGSELSAATVSATGWYEWDVSSYVRSEKEAGRTQVTLLLATSGRNTNPATFNSREAANHTPQLTFTSAGLANQAPTVAAPATAIPATVSGTSTALAVLGADDGGEANLSYTWSSVGSPPAPVSFTPSTGRAVSATFTRAGTYLLQATITDQAGATTTSTVTTTVSQNLTTVTVAPGSASLAPGGTQQFSAAGFDQFGIAMSPAPNFSWSVNGGGSISLSGLFTASNTPGGPFTVMASSGNRSSTANLNVVGTTLTLRALADAYVRGGDYGALNYGTALDLQVKSDGSHWTRHSYLKFDLGSVSGALSNVKLRLFGSIPGGEQVPIHLFPVADTSWSELSLTWNNKPQPGPNALGFVTVTGAAGTWYEWDVTSYVNAERAAGRTVVAFVLLNPGTNTQLPSFVSDESANNWPQLVATSG